MTELETNQQMDQTPQIKTVRDKELYTQSARELHDALAEVDVSDWHLAANKWSQVSAVEK